MHIASHIAHIPASQEIKPTDRLMHSFGIGNLNCLKILLFHILRKKALSLDNVLGYVLEAVCTFFGASVAFEDKVLPLKHTVNVDSVLSSIQVLKPTIYGG